jgi:endonuclease/exonuclease/phosphatase family metal-dependent hydrolase
MTTEHKLRLLSYNIQGGIGTAGYHHYVTQSWKHVLPHRSKHRNLDRVAQIASDYDIVALQETDAGSLRSNFINLAEYLAEKADFPFWHDQVNRNMGKFAQHSNSLLSKIRPSEVVDHKLPGLIPGRGALMVRFGNKNDSLVIFVVHLALSPRTRKSQLAFIAEQVQEHKHVVMMGDMNCEVDSHEMKLLFRHTHLQEPEYRHHTFPSWRPQKHIDHILVSNEVHVLDVQTLNQGVSDHLPVAMEIGVPETIKLF